MAVDHVSLEVTRGTLKSIIGPNGAGKTTFFNLLSGQHRPSEGRIAFEGRDITTWSAYRSFPDLEDRAYALLADVLLENKWAAPAGTLAHGEKRKLEIGILLALEPALLLLDEPTAGMSLEEVPTIVALIDRIRARRTEAILLVEHKIDMVMTLSDTIAVLRDGRLIADDTPSAIARNPEVQAAYFGGGAARA